MIDFIQEKTVGLEGFLRFGVRTLKRITDSVVGSYEFHAGFFHPVMYFPDCVAESIGHRFVAATEQGEFFTGKIESLDSVKEIIPVIFYVAGTPCGRSEHQNVIFSHSGRSGRSHVIYIFLIYSEQRGDASGNLFGSPG